MKSFRDNGGLTVWLWTVLVGLREYRLLASGVPQWQRRMVVGQAYAAKRVHEDEAWIFRRRQAEDMRNVEWWGQEVARVMWTAKA